MDKIIIFVDRDTYGVVSCLLCLPIYVYIYIILKKILSFAIVLENLNDVSDVIVLIYESKNAGKRSVQTIGFSLGGRGPPEISIFNCRGGPPSPDIFLCLFFNNNLQETTTNPYFLLVLLSIHFIQHAGHNPLHKKKHIGLCCRSSSARSLGETLRASCAAGGTQQ